MLGAIDYTTDIAAAKTEVLGGLTAVAPTALVVAGAFVGFRVVKRLVSGLGR